MFNQKICFQIQRKTNQGQGRNKQNNLSFRNIAANSQSQNQGIIKTRGVDKSFKSICENLNSLYSSGDDLQQQLNYVGSCFNHSNKLAEYVQTISQQQCCKLCAARLASLGYKLEKSQNFVSRDISPSVLQRHQSHTHLRNPNQILKYPNQIIEQKVRINSSNVSVKLSTIRSQKSRFIQSIDAKYELNQKVIEEYVQFYSQKMENIQQLLRTIKIKDTQYMNRLKSQNRNIYDQAKNAQLFQSERGGFDLFGKSLLKQSTNENVKFKLPSDDRLQKLARIYQQMEQITHQKKQALIPKNIALIKSINSNQSNNAKNLCLKNSSSVSNFSSKSNFKKQKKKAINEDKFASQFNGTKYQKQQVEIQNSRFSSNSAIIRKKSHHSSNAMKTESTQIKRINTEKSLRDSESCQDTPQSIKSKISGNSFVLPRIAAITMFQKINICESIDIKPEQNLENQVKKQRNFLNETNNQNSRFYLEKGKSPCTNKSQNKLISVASRGRKSFNRYQNSDNQ